MYRFCRRASEGSINLFKVSGTCRNVRFSSSSILSEENMKLCIKNVSNLSLQHDFKKFDSLKKAAVLIPLCEVNGEPSLLFTVRSFDLKRNRGQVSFPGGNAEPQDKTTIETALRETNEEIGLSPDRVKVWTILPNMSDGSLTTNVAGILGNLGKLNVNELVPNKNEVHHIFTVPILTLCSNVQYTAFRAKPRKVSPWDYITPVFLTDHKIWGLTATFTDYTLSCLVPNYKAVSNVYNTRFHQLKNS